MNRPSLRPSIAAVAVAIAVILAGCGVSASTDSAGLSTGPGKAPTAPANTPAYLSQAAANTAAATTYKMAMTVTMSGVSGAGDLTVKADGEFDAKAERAHLTEDLGSLFGALGSSSGVSVPKGSSTIEVVLDGKTVYVKSGLLSMLGGGSDKPWVKVDASEMSGGSSITGGGTGTNPTGLLDLLTTEGNGLKELGHETLRGVDTRHVGTTIDLAKALADAPASSKAQLEEQLQSLGGSLDSFVTIPVEAWIDADGQVRKFTMTFDFAKAGKDVPELAKAKATITVELYDLGKPVDIAVPPASQVSELDPSSLLGGN